MDGSKKYGLTDARNWISRECSNTPFGSNSASSDNKLSPRFSHLNENVVSLYQGEVKSLSENFDALETSNCDMVSEERAGDTKKPGEDCNSSGNICYQVLNNLSESVIFKSFQSDANSCKVSTFCHNNENNDAVSKNCGNINKAINSKETDKSFDFGDLNKSCETSPTGIRKTKVLASSGFGSSWTAHLRRSRSCPELFPQKTCQDNSISCFPNGDVARKENSVPESEAGDITVDGELKMNAQSEGLSGSGSATLVTFSDTNYEQASILPSVCQDSLSGYGSHSLLNNQTSDLPCESSKSAAINITSEAMEESSAGKNTAFDEKDSPQKETARFELISQELDNLINSYKDSPEDENIVEYSTSNNEVPSDCTNIVNWQLDTVSLPSFKPQIKPPDWIRVTIPADGYRCNACGDVFYIESSLVQHRERRSVWIILQCSSCKERLNFYNRCALKEHVYQHLSNGESVNCYGTILVRTLPFQLIKLWQALRISEPEKSSLNETTTNPVDCGEAESQHDCLSNTDSGGDIQIECSVSLANDRENSNFVPTPVKDSVCNMQSEEGKENRASISKARTPPSQPMLCCYLCGRHFIDSDALVEHMRTDLSSTDVRVECKKCLLVLPSMCAAKAHILTHPPANPNNISVCPECGSVCDSPKVFVHHLNTCGHQFRRSGYLCPKCRVCFYKNLDDLVLHLIEAHCCKTYKCVECQDIYNEPIVHSCSFKHESPKARGKFVRNKNVIPTFRCFLICPLCSMKIQVNGREEAQFCNRLKLHLEFSHPSIVKTTHYVYKSKFCSNSFSSKEELWYHHESEHKFDDQYKLRSCSLHQDSVTLQYRYFDGGTPEDAFVVLPSRESNKRVPDDNMRHSVQHLDPSCNGVSVTKNSRPVLPQRIGVKRNLLKEMGEGNSALKSPDCSQEIVNNDTQEDINQLSYKKSDSSLQCNYESFSRPTASKEGFLNSIGIFRVRNAQGTTDAVENTTKPSNSLNSFSEFSGFPNASKKFSSISEVNEIASALHSFPVCYQCGMVFGLSDLKMHNSLCNFKEAERSCRVCSARASGEEFYMHCLSHLEAKVWVCMFCNGLQFNTWRDLENHFGRHAREQFVYPTQCAFCPKLMEGITTALDHLIEKHRNGLNDKLVDIKVEDTSEQKTLGGILCTQCGKSFITERGLGIHKKKCRSKICLACKKSVSPDVFGKHFVNHLEEGLPSCSMCDCLVFSSPVTLRLHLETHAMTLEYPHTCPACKVVMSNPVTCLNHLKEDHGFGNISCTQCDMKFKFTHAIKRHLDIVHSKSQNSTKRFVCWLCRSFDHSRKDVVIDHLKTVHKVSKEEVRGETMIAIKVDGSISMCVDKKFSTVRRDADYFNKEVQVRGGVARVIKNELDDKSFLGTSRTFHRYPHWTGKIEDLEIKKEIMESFDINGPQGLGDDKLNKKTKVLVKRIPRGLTKVKAYELNGSAGNKIHKCDTCDYTTRYEFKISRHIRKHVKLKESSYKCKICRQAFVVEVSLRRHMFFVHKIKYELQKSQIESVVDKSSKENKKVWRGKCSTLDNKNRFSNRSIKSELMDHLDLSSTYDGNNKEIKSIDTANYQGVDIGSFSKSSAKRAAQSTDRKTTLRGCMDGGIKQKDHIIKREPEDVTPLVPSPSQIKRGAVSIKGKGMVKETKSDTKVKGKHKINSHMLKEKEIKEEPSDYIESYKLTGIYRRTRSMGVGLGDTNQHSINSVKLGEDISSHSPEQKSSEKVFKKTEFSPSILEDSFLSGEEFEGFTPTKKMEIVKIEGNYNERSGNKVEKIRFGNCNEERRKARVGRRELQDKLQKVSNSKPKESIRGLGKRTSKEARLTTDQLLSKLSKKQLAEQLKRQLSLTSNTRSSRKAILKTRAELKPNLFGNPACKPFKLLRSSTKSKECVSKQLDGNISLSSNGKLLRQSGKTTAKSALTKVKKTRPIRGLKVRSKYKRLAKAPDSKEEIVTEYPCPSCSISLNTPVELYAHINNHHADL